MKLLQDMLVKYSVDVGANSQESLKNLETYIDGLLLSIDEKDAAIASKSQEIADKDVLISAYNLDAE